MASNVIAISEFEFEAAKGAIKRLSVADKFGRVVDVDTGETPTDIWTTIGTYPGFPTGDPETLEVFSSDVNDTGAGTGARTISIRNLLNDDGEPMPDITVTLNGTTPVSLGAELYYRCSRMRVETVGVSGHNEGTITVRHTTTTANIFAVMPAERNTTTLMAYTIPVGFELYVKRGNITLARASGAAGSANCTIRVREHGSDKPFVALRDIEITDSSPYKFENNGYMTFSARVDLKVTVESVSDNDTIVSSEFDGYLLEV